MGINLVQNTYVYTHLCHLPLFLDTWLKKDGPRWHASIMPFSDDTLSIKLKNPDSVWYGLPTRTKMDSSSYWILLELVGNARIRGDSKWWTQEPTSPLRNPGKLKSRSNGTWWWSCRQWCATERCGLISPLCASNLYTLCLPANTQANIWIHQGPRE